MIREIAWRLREIGNDGRICDLIDLQVSVIEKGAEQISSDEAKSRARRRLRRDRGTAGGIRRRRDAGAGRRSASVSPAPAAPEAPAAIEPDARTGRCPALQAGPDSDRPISTAEAELRTKLRTGGTEACRGDERAEPAELTTEAADAHDEAMLDMIAMEMGAPDPIRRR